MLNQPPRVPAIAPPLRRPARRRPAARSLVVLALLSLLVGVQRLAAWGPPFQTDDPEPVPLRHWEFYLASLGFHDMGQTMATGPHIEVNYGALPGLQLHMITPFTYVKVSGAPSAYGYGDTELGAKYRFLKETATTPEIGTFPLVEVPTGDPARRLGSGHTQFFLPIWAQKSWGHWSGYGGTGYWHNPGAGNKNWNFTGVELQRDAGKFGWLGGEVFHTTAAQIGGAAATSFNMGGQFDFSKVHHLIFSAGRNITGPHQDLWYVAYYLTI